jgi:Cu(I)/Ag(I) efflux system membrane fusion protein
MKGQRIMDIYSPELLITEQELLFILKNDSNNSSLINAAKQKIVIIRNG